ncbi:MAG: HTH domain-containing protein [Phycisphaerales bacterium]|nr:HTH domain-containing protein [Phycisphaerales bacterium]
MYKRSEQIENRLRSVIRLLRKGHYSTPMLASALKVSKPTISRCVLALRERGYSIRSVNNGGRWAYEIADERAKLHGSKGGAR